MSRAITRLEAIELELVLGPHVRNGEDFADALRRIIRERDLAIYDAGRNTNAFEEARSYRRMFFAACLSQPNQELRVKVTSVADVSGSVNDYELVVVDDPTSHESICRVRRR